MSLAVYDKLLSDFAERCSIKNTKTLRKSRELVCLLNSKNSINCSEICKVLVCLELAATSTSVSICRDLCVKLSGCTKRNYVNNFNNISKLLKLDKIYTVKEICLLVGVSQIADDAFGLFKKYQSVTTIEPSLIEHPMYACAATLAVSEMEKLPVRLSTLIEISRVKKADLKKLSIEFSKLYVKKSSNSFEKDVKLENQTYSNDYVHTRDDYSRDKIDEMSDEKYKGWKIRMLQE